MQDYATDGLRTLCVAMREIPEQEYREWARIYESAAATIQNRGEALDNAAELIERNMFLLGATAIEDKLQDGVPETIHTLQTAGIKVWVLTGDRQETAINIGLSCRLISESMNLVSHPLLSLPHCASVNPRPGAGHRKRAKRARHARLLVEAPGGRQGAARCGRARGIGAHH